MATRREKIEAMLVDDPTDTFLRYSLAMELDKEGENDSSLEKLRELTQDETPYIPAFFMGGQQLAPLGSRDRITRHLARWHRAGPHPGRLARSGRDERVFGFAWRARRVRLKNRTRRDADSTD